MLIHKCKIPKLNFVVGGKIENCTLYAFFHASEVDIENAPRSQDPKFSKH